MTATQQESRVRREMTVQELHLIFDEMVRTAKSGLLLVELDADDISWKYPFYYNEAFETLVRRCYRFQDPSEANILQLSLKLASRIYELAVAQNPHTTQPSELPISLASLNGHMMHLVVESRQFTTETGRFIQTFRIRDQTTAVNDFNRLNAIYEVLGQKETVFTLVLNNEGDWVVDLIRVSQISKTLEPGQEAKYKGIRIEEFIYDKDPILRQVAIDGYLAQIANTVNNPGAATTGNYVLNGLYYYVTMNYLNGELTVRSQNISDVVEAQLLAHEAQAIAREMNSKLTGLQNFTRHGLHDLGTFASNIFIALSLLKKEMGSYQNDAEKVANIISLRTEVIAANARLIKDLITSMRQFAQLGKKLEDLDITSINVQDLLQEIVSANPDRIRLNMPAQSLLISSDKGHVRQAISNLVSNALKYSPEDSTVVINLQRAGGGIIIEVIDTGIGIPPEYLAHIFTPFTRAENVGDRGGTGLGLAACKDTIAVLRGDLTIQSEVNKGTRVICRLPFSTEGDLEEA